MQFTQTKYFLFLWKKKNNGFKYYICVINCNGLSNDKILVILEGEFAKNIAQIKSFHF